MKYCVSVVRGTVMDNIKFEIRLEAKYIKDALAFFMKIRSMCNNPPTSYCIHPKYGMILLRLSENSERQDINGHSIVSIPPIRYDDFVESWLKDVNPEDFEHEDKWDGRYDSYDVDNHKAFCMYVEDWGHVAGMWEAKVAIKPAWAWYGK